MKSILKSMALAAIVSLAPVAASAQMPALTPAPVSVAAGEGSYLLPKDKLTVSASGEAAASAALQSLEALLGRYGRSLAPAKSAAKADIVLTIDSAAADTASAEGYDLSITAKGIRITATDRAGLFYGVQTLRQILAQAPEGNLPALSVSDSPRFGYRGLMVDVTRFFLPFDDLKRIVDIASTLKINNIHLHLTDDNGWRLEIKRYPRLTEVGAWRVDRPEIFPARRNQTEGEPATYGGFYTQDQMRELVDYAAARHINIVPEIEMPAHAVAALASYPELTCPVQTEYFGVLPGIGGNAASIIACAGNDSVYTFYERVLDEVMDIFPSRMIHLGGDEADKTHWRACELCNARLKELGLDNFEQLQGYFMDRINRYVRDHGREAIGWDEVTIGQPKEDIVIMGWRGHGDAAVKYARSGGSRFIMTPAQSLYLIRYQGPQWFEPFTYFGNNTLADVWGYEPVGDNWDEDLESRLLGIQGSLWTEFCHSTDDVEYLLFPRTVALADNAWRRKGSGDWSAFLAALDSYLPTLDSLGVNHARSMYNLQHTAKASGSDRTLTLDIASQRPDLEVRMGADSASLAGGRIVSGPVTVDAATKTLSFAAFKDGRQQGRVLRLDFVDGLGRGARVAESKSTTGHDYVLTNGLRGSDRNSDFEWAGWVTPEALFTIDLGEISPVNTVAVGNLANANLCIAAPTEVELLLSEDGTDFESAGIIAESDSARIFPLDSTIRDYRFDNVGRRARYIRIRAVNPGHVPDGYPREGRSTVIYFDEVMVNDSPN